MKATHRVAIALSTAILCLSAPAADTEEADLAVPEENRRNSLKATLEGNGEVPVISTLASGEFEARINHDETSFTYEVTYRDLQGTVTQSHIHLGQKDVNGGIMVFLCSNLAGAPAGTQPCPVPGGTVTGTIDASHVIGPAGQGVAQGEFAEVIAAMRTGLAYANVHSTLFPGGEIRGQLK